MREKRLEPKRLTFVHADTETPPSMVLVEARFGGAAGSLRTTPPLCLYRSHGERVFTEEMQTVLYSGELPTGYLP